MIEKYNAFISYKHAPLDNRIAETVQRDLERYTIPRRIREQTGTRKIERIFRDQAELPITSDLDDNISFALEHSDFLIVICSKSTKLSGWVPREIEFFLRFHPISHVLTVLAEGEPWEVIPEILLKKRVPVIDPGGKPVPDENGEPLTEEKPLEPLSCDYRLPRRQARRRELPRLAAAIIGCSYDELIMRARQYRMRRLAILGSLAAILMSAAIAYLLWSRAQIRQNYRQALINQSVFLAHASERMLDQSHDGIGAAQLALAALGEEGERPVTPQAIHALTEAIHAYMTSDRANGKFPDAKYEMGGSIRDFAIDKDGAILYILADSGDVGVFDIRSQERLFTKKVRDANAPRMFLIPAEDGTLLLCDGFCLSLLDWRSGEELWRRDLWAEEGSASDPRVAGADLRYYIQLNGLLAPEVYPPVAAALSPDGKILAVDGGDDRVWLVDAADGEILRTLSAGIPSGEEPVSAFQKMTWSENGRWLAAAYLDDTGERDTVLLLVFDTESGNASLYDTGDPSFENLCFAWDDAVAIMTRDESWNGSSLMLNSGIEGYGATMFPSSSRLAFYSLEQERLLWKQELAWHAPWKNEGQIRALRLELSGREELLPAIACSASNMAYLLDVRDGAILAANEQSDSVIAIMDYSQVLMLLRNGDSSMLHFSGSYDPNASHTQYPHFFSTSTPYDIEKILRTKTEEGAAYYCLSSGAGAIIRFRQLWDRDGVSYGETGVAEKPAGLWQCGSHLIVCNDRKELLCFDTGSDRLVWRFQPENGNLKRAFVLHRGDQYRFWVYALDAGGEGLNYLLDPADGSFVSISLDHKPLSSAGDAVYWVEQQADGSVLVGSRSFDGETDRTLTIPDFEIAEKPTFTISPDGSRIALETADGLSLWQTALAGGELRQATENVRTACLFAWSEDASCYAVCANTDIRLFDTEGKLLVQFPTEGSFPVNISFEGERLYVLYRSGTLHAYRRSDGAFLAAVDLGFETEEYVSYTLLAQDGTLYLQGAGEQRFLAILDEESLVLECLVEHAVGYFPETGKILIGDVNVSSGTYQLTAFEHYSPERLREKALSFIGGSEMSEEMREQFGLSG